MTVNEIPKIVLHLHLDGSIDVDDAYKWVKEDGIVLTKKEMLKKMQVDDQCHSLNDYLEKFNLACKLLQTCARLEETSYHLFKKLAKMNVVYAEVRFAPNKHLEKGLNLDAKILKI